MSVNAIVREVMPRTGAPKALDALERLLRDGAAVGPPRLLGTSGVNGAMRRVTLGDRTGGAATVEAIVRPAHAQAAQEVFGWRLARQLGIDYLFPAAALRRDGSAMVQFLPGTTADRAGITSVEQLREEIAAMYRRTSPELLAGGAAEQARIDIELAQVVDYLVANSDRRPANLLFDAATGATTYIDIGNMGANGLHRFRPMLMPQFMGAGPRGSIELHPRTLAVLRANLDDAAIRQLHGELVSDLSSYRPAPQATIHQRGLQRILARAVSRPSFADDISARRARLLETGRLDYEPMKPALAIPATVARAYGPRLLVGAAAGNVAAGAWLVRRSN